MWNGCKAFFFSIIFPSSLLAGYNNFIGHIYLLGNVCMYVFMCASMYLYIYVCVYVIMPGIIEHILITAKSFH